MKVRKKLLIFLFVLFTVILLNTKVKAASAKLSASSTNVSVGNSVTITTTINGATWQVNVSGAVSGNYVGYTDDAEDTTTTKTLSFTPSSAGTYTVKLSGNVTGSNDASSTPVSDSITITATNSSSSSSGSASSTSSSSSSSSSSTSTESTEKSSIATLSNLGITPNDFTGFSASTYSYDVEVPKDVEQIEIYASKGQSGQTIEGIGNKELQEGLNTFEVKVTAEDGTTTKTYTLNITRMTEEEKFGLASLLIKGITIEPEFNTEVYEYKLKLTEDLDKIDIETTATDENATVEIIGNENLVEGENTITIQVTSENGEKIASYTLLVEKQIEVTKSSKDQDSNKFANLSKKDIMLIAALGIELLAIIVVLIIIIKKSKNKNDDYYFGEGNNEFDYTTPLETNFEHQENDAQDNKSNEDNIEEKMYLETSNDDNTEKEPINEQQEVVEEQDIEKPKDKKDLINEFLAGSIEQEIPEEKPNKKKRSKGKRFK